MEDHLLMGETFDFLWDAGVVFLVEPNNNVFEVGEDVLLVDLDLTSSFGLCALEVKIAVGTDEIVFLLGRDGI